MSKTKAFVSGVGVGTGMMYYLDRHQGRRRRVMTRDRAVHFVREAADLVDKGARDIRHRTEGRIADLTSPFREHDTSNDAVVQRVRSKLGRAVSHPHAIEVSADNGTVTLSGPVFTDEVKGLLSSVRKLPGVRKIEDRLDRHSDAGSVSSLQGEGKIQGERSDWRQDNWSPATRLLGIVGGGTAAIYGLSFRNPIGWLMTGAGTVLGLRALSNLPLPQLFGVGKRGSILVHKTIEVNAPIEEVYRFWEDFSNFPKFMSDVKEVRLKDGDGRISHWTVAGPAGAPVSWDAEVTRKEANQTIAWRALPGAVIHNAGRVRFEDKGGGCTRVDLDFSYLPPAGALGHVAARLFGADARSLLNESLMQFKTILETGKAGEISSQAGQTPGLTEQRPEEESKEGAGAQSSSTSP